MQGTRHVAVVCYCKYLITQLEDPVNNGEIRQNRQARRVSNCDNLVWIPIYQISNRA